MQCCPLTHTLHTSTVQHNDAQQRNPLGTLYGLMTAIAARFGWYRLEQLLSAIPDSNDDFMMF
jgi:hypothetical protein